MHFAHTSKLLGERPVARQSTLASEHEYELASLLRAYGCGERACAAAAAGTIAARGLLRVQEEKEVEEQEVGEEEKEEGVVAEEVERVAG